MVAAEQLKIFLSCVFIGFIGGVFHDLFDGVVAPMKNEKWEGKARLLYEIAYFLAFAMAFVALQARLGFPDLRGYVFIGISIGFWVYYKNLQIILAFLKKVCYNITTKLFCKRKNSQKKR